MVDCFFSRFNCFGSSLTVCDKDSAEFGCGRNVAAEGFEPGDKNAVIGRIHSFWRASLLKAPAQGQRGMCGKVRIIPYFVINLKSGYVVGIPRIFGPFFEARSCLPIGSSTWFAPCRNRTYNPVIKSHLLCQLS